MTVIYKISSICKPERCYVGSSVHGFDSRRARHLKDLKKEKHHSPKLQNHYNKYGKDDLVFEVLEELKCSCGVIKAEQKWIDELNPFFNIRRIAESNLGLKHSEETKRKISDWNRQRRHSEETKKKISQVQKGKVIPEETKERMRLAKLGKKRGSYKKRNENKVLLESN